MTAALLLAFALASGADVRLVAMAAGAVWWPIPTAAAVVAVAVAARRFERRRADEVEVRFLDVAVAELRSGGSARHAMRTACASIGDCERIVRRLDAGLPLDASLDGLGTRLPVVGGLVGDAVAAAGGGGRMLPVLEELVAAVTAERAVAAELATATAQVRSSMMLLAGAPLAFLVWSIWTGRMAELMALPGGAFLAAAGGALFLSGTLAMLVLYRRVR